MLNADDLWQHLARSVKSLRCTNPAAGPQQPDVTPILLDQWRYAGDDRVKRHKIGHQRPVGQGGEIVGGSERCLTIDEKNNAWDPSFSRIEPLSAHRFVEVLSERFFLFQTRCKGKRNPTYTA